MNQITKIYCDKTNLSRTKLKKEKNEPSSSVCHRQIWLAWRKEEEQPSWVPAKNELQR